MSDVTPYSTAQSKGRWAAASEKTCPCGRVFRGVKDTCVKCRARAKCAEYSLAYRKANPEAVRARRLKDYATNRAARNRQSADWRKRNPDYAAAQNRLITYGLTREGLRALLDACDHKCPGCQRALTESRVMAVDHDHTCCPGKASCGKCIRGVLCRKCNSAMGLVKDDPKVLRNLVDYLEKPR